MSRNTGTYARTRGDEGIALILVLGYLAVVTLLVATFLASLNRNVTRANKAQWRQVCLQIAEGGVDQAIASLRMGNVGDQSASLGDGQFTATVRASGNAYEIVSTATLTDSLNVQARVRALVEREAGGAIRVLQWNEVTKW